MRKMGELPLWGFFLPSPSSRGSRSWETALPPAPLVPCPPTAVPMRQVGRAGAESVGQSRATKDEPGKAQGREPADPRPTQGQASRGQLLGAGSRWLRAGQPGDTVEALEPGGLTHSPEADGDLSLKEAGPLYPQQLPSLSAQDTPVTMKARCASRREQHTHTLPTRHLIWGQEPNRRTSPPAGVGSQPTPGHLHLCLES